MKNKKKTVGGYYDELTPKDETQRSWRLPNDPDSVTHLLDEFERLSKMGNDMVKINQIGAEACLRTAWAYCAAAGHLRCYLKGELLDKPPLDKPLPVEPKPNE